MPKETAVAAGFHTKMEGGTPGEILTRLLDRSAAYQAIIPEAKSKEVPIDEEMPDDFASDLVSVVAKLCPGGAVATGSGDAGGGKPEERKQIAADMWQLVVRKRRKKEPGAASGVPAIADGA